MKALRHTIGYIIMINIIPGLLLMLWPFFGYGRFRWYQVWGMGILADVAIIVFVGVIGICALLFEE